MTAEDIESLITIDENDSSPLYIQLRRRIVYLIISGILREGDRLPTVRELAVKLGINYNTVNRAYTDLERDKYLVSRRHLGTFVAAPLSEVSEQDDTRGVVQSLVEELVRQCDELGVPRSILLDIVKSYTEENHPQTIRPTGKDGNL